jgi:hypothetical protein
MGSPIHHREGKPLMASPSTIVTFEDVDGDEFPVRVWESYAGSPIRRNRIVNAATAELQRLEDAGELKPRRPIVVTKIEAT